MGFEYTHGSYAGNINWYGSTYTYIFTQHVIMAYSYRWKIQKSAVPISIVRDLPLMKPADQRSVIQMSYDITFLVTKAAIYSVKKSKQCNIHAMSAPQLVGIKYVIHITTFLVLILLILIFV